MPESLYFSIMMGTLGVTGVTPKRSSLLSFFLWVTLDQVTVLVVVVFSIGVLMGGWGGVGWGLVIDLQTPLQT